MGKPFLVALPSNGVSKLPPYGVNKIFGSWAKQKQALRIGKPAL